MPPSAEVSQVQAEECLAEALSTLTILAFKDDIRNLVTNLPNDPRYQQPATPPTDLHTITDSLLAGRISSVGVSLFVFPYERYKKKLIAVGYTNYQQKASEVFTANTFNTRVNFEAAFPNSVVHVWAAPTPQAALSFAADSIRNSFAHGQSTLVTVNGVQMLDIWNSQSGEFVAANFHVQMTPLEFWQLARQCMNAFVTNAVQHQLLVPFQTLLNQVSLT